MSSMIPSMLTKQSNKKEDKYDEFDEFDGDDMFNMQRQSHNYRIYKFDYYADFVDVLNKWVSVWFTFSIKLWDFEVLNLMLLRYTAIVLFTQIYIKLIRLKSS